MSTLEELIKLCNKEVDRIINEKEEFVIYIKEQQQQNQQKNDSRIQMILEHLKKIEDDNNSEN